MNNIILHINLIYTFNLFKMKKYKIIANRKKKNKIKPYLNILH